MSSSQTTNESPAKKPSGWGHRHTFIIAAFCVMILNVSLRVNLSLAIVGMVSGGSDTTGELGHECPFPDDTGTSSNSSNVDDLRPSMTFDWDAQEQGIILGAFYYGFIVTPLPGGFLAERYGAKWVVFSSLLLASICSLLSPPAAIYGGKPALIAVKVLQGLFQGPLIPGVTSLFSNWIPASERSRGMTIVWGGNRIATVVTFALCGLVAEEIGWEWDFYIFGILGLVVCVFWTFLCYNSPSVHPRISEEEKAYLKNEIDSSHTEDKKKLPVPPYGRILTSVPFLAMVLTNTTMSWGMNTLMTEVPTYLNNVQHIPLTLNGLVSALPFLLSFFWSLPISWLSDWLISKDKMSRGKVRKIMSTLALSGPALGLILLTFVGCNPTMVVVILCVSVMVTSSQLSGFNLNNLELSPNYAGTLKAMTNTVSNICGFVTPTLIGAITNGQQTLVTWNKVFYIAAGVYVFGNAIFVVFGRTSIQPWNTYWKEEKPTAKTPLTWHSDVKKKQASNPSS